MASKRRTTASLDSGIWARKKVAAEKTGAVKKPAAAKAGSGKVAKKEA
jgi:hypothetical protein